MRLVLAIFISLALAAEARAAAVKDGCLRVKVGSGENITQKIVDAGAIDSTQTVSLDNPGYSQFTLAVSYTHGGGAATAVTVAPYCSPDGSASIRMQTTSCSSGTCTRYARTDTKATGGGNTTVEYEIDVARCKSITLDIDGTAADGSESIDAYGTFCYRIEDD